MLGRNFTVNRDTLEVTTERIIHSSATKLYEDYSNPLLIPRWWGEKSLNTTVDKLDLRLGGSWRYKQTEPNGSSYAWSGIYQELNKPHKVISTFVFEPMPGHVHVGTVLFNSLADGTTQLVERIKFLNVEDLNNMVNMDMKQKSAERLDRLAAVVESPLTAQVV